MEGISGVSGGDIRDSEGISGVSEGISGVSEGISGIVRRSKVYLGLQKTWLIKKKFKTEK